jgi:hypothetical protein
VILVSSRFILIGLAVGLVAVVVIGVAVSAASRASVWVENRSAESVAFFVTDNSDGPAGYFVVPPHTTAHAGSDGIGLVSRDVRVNVLHWIKVTAGDPCTPTDYDDTIYNTPAGASVRLLVEADGQPSVTLAPEPSGLPHLDALPGPTCQP